MSRKDIHTPTSTMGVQNSGHPSVREKAPGPQSKQIDYKIAKSTAPDSGQTHRIIQRGHTSPKTDAGGGMGNSSEALHRKIFGK